MDIERPIGQHWIRETTTARRDARFKRTNGETTKEEEDCLKGAKGRRRNLRRGT